MGILRSEEMRKATLVLPVERAREYISKMARSANLQFEDMNGDSMKRPYKKFIQRIDEMERILRYLAEEMKRTPDPKGPDGSVMYDAVIRERFDDFLANDHGTLDNMEQVILKIYKDFQQFQTNNESLLDAKHKCIEEKWVVTAATMYSRGAKQAVMSDAAEEGTSLMGGGADDGPQFSSIAGTIVQSDQERFARTIFRATRGNTFTHFQPITDHLYDVRTHERVQKSVFVVYYQGGVTSNMRDKVQRICSAFGANIYPWPTGAAATQQRARELDDLIADKAQALKAYDRFVSTEMQAMIKQARPGANSQIEEWRMFCLKEKAIYATLNLFEGDTTLRADCWYPLEEEERIRRILVDLRGSDNMSGMLLTDNRATEASKVMPPTYFKPNDIVLPAQWLVNTYGIPRYQEANPAIFAVVTFPFIFGIMFGDVGHGLCLMLGGLWLMANADELKFTTNENLKVFLIFRYMIAMMGFFALYAGLMYSEVVGVGVMLFDSSWKEPADLDPKAETWTLTNSGSIYPFGLDPAWHGATNELLFVNSMKMKIAVLFGVTQMLLGLALRFGNALYFRNWIDFFCECIPMTIFMICFFGYMDWMIMYKWVTPMKEPPSIINTLIGMGLGLEEKHPLYDGQSGVQSTLMVLTAISVPWILIPKPLILWWQHNSAQAHRYQELALDNELDPLGAAEMGGFGGGAGPGKVAAEEFELGEIVIHQLIETIEYVLGTVSHTASYLRTWALSLAHQQLSLVFLQKILLSQFGLPIGINGIAIYIGFALFANVTAGILLGMDVLECFLHTLRLHWVEFQSKFFKADGHVFVPLSMRSVLEADQR